MTSTRRSNRRSNSARFRRAPHSFELDLPARTHLDLYPAVVDLHIDAVHRRCCDRGRARRPGGGATPAW